MYNKLVPDLEQGQDRKRLQTFSSEAAPHVPLRGVGAITELELEWQLTVTESSVVSC